MTNQVVEPMKGHFLGNKVYDFLKFLALILLPALGTLYFALAAIWNLPEAEEVVGTVTAVDAFLGVLVRFAASSYDKSDTKYGGVINVDETDDKKNFSLVVHGDPEAIDQHKEVLFKVNSK